MTYTFIPQGTCSKKIEIDYEGDIIQDVRFTKGCTGNLTALGRLMRGQRISEVVERTKGIQCQNGTSCADQLSIALERILALE